MAMISRSMMVLVMVVDCDVDHISFDHALGFQVVVIDYSVMTMMMGISLMMMMGKPLMMIKQKPDTDPRVVR